MNLQLNTTNLISSLPSTAHPALTKHFSKSYLLVIGQLVLGILLILVGIVGLIFLPAMHYFLTASFLIPASFILGLMVIFSAIEDILHIMGVWRTTSLKLRNQFHSQELPYSSTPFQKNWKNALISYPPDIYSSTSGISKTKMYSTAGQIILGIGCLIGCFCSGCFLSNISRTVLCTSLGGLGSALLTSGIKSYRSFILNSYGIVYFYLALNEKLSSLQATQRYEDSLKHLQNQVHSLENELRNQTEEQTRLVLNYEKKLAKSRTSTQTTQPAASAELTLTQMAKQLLSSVQPPSLSLDLFWAGDDE